ncbi:MAG TPA: signal peptidase I [Clostridia bacterium]|nr:signal peptidase I [Clostridia bacterium]
MARGRRIRSAIYDVLFLAIIAFLLFGLYKYIFMSVTVEGVSMQSTLYDKDKVLVIKGGKYGLDDIVVFNTHLRDDGGGERYFVKRIIGLPGDEISINYDDEQDMYFVWRNGAKLIESYIDSESPLDAEMPSIVVPEGQFFFLGDNRGHSSDSRMGMMGKLDSISGRVIARYRLNGDKFDFEFIKRPQ